MQLALKICNSGISVHIEETLKYSVNILVLGIQRHTSGDNPINTQTTAPLKTIKLIKSHTTVYMHKAKYQLY